MTFGRDEKPRRDAKYAYLRATLLGDWVRRPFRARVDGVPLTQAVGLGFVRSPLWGSKNLGVIGSPLFGRAFGQLESIHV